MPNPNVGFFVVWALGITSANAGFTWNECVAYLSCLTCVELTYGYDSSELASECVDYLPPGMTQDMAYEFQKMGYELGSGFENMYTLEQVGQLMVSYCSYYGAVGLATDNEYYGFHYDYYRYKECITGAIEKCPGGGTSASTDKIGIGTCHTNTFSDVSGSGVFQEDCYYTE